MKSNLGSVEFPLRHVSVRVPWHDAGWAGLVCHAPQLNGACAKLKGIAGRKKEDQEAPNVGRSLEDLPREQWPCCVAERATFMAPFQMEQVKLHALAAVNSEQYGHFQPTPQHYPPFSAGIVPFRWLMRENLELYGDLLDLDVDLKREPDLGYESSWLHEAENQKALLEAFAAHLRPQDSLSFFYAKHVPFVEGTGRILIGVGRINNLSPLTEYKREGEGMRGMVWERPVQHSIRPKGQDGFLLPYYEILKCAEKDPSLDLERYVAKAPDENWDEFSYASELVTHDGAIGALLSIETVLGRIESELGIATGWQRSWVHEELVRLWKVRGPFPGSPGRWPGLALKRTFGAGRAAEFGATGGSGRGNGLQEHPASIRFFANSVLHAHEMAARLSHAGISAAAISGETPTSARRYFLDRFQSGKIRVLCNHSVLTTGFDAPETEMVFIARQVFSPIRYMQMVGRGLRGEKNGGTAQFRFPSSTVAVCA